jgi:putative FmdB family regulatory protein
MPNYSYYCKFCDIEHDRIVLYEDREASYECPSCGEDTEYVFPLTRSVWGAMEYHDESLGVDIHGRRHRQQVMRAMGVQEAGDSVGGARNFETAHATGILPPVGSEYSDMQRKEEKARKAQQDKTVTFIDKGGKERSYRHGDMKNDIPALKVQVQ